MRDYEVLWQRWWGVFNGPLQSTLHTRCNRQNPPFTNFLVKVQNEAFPSDWSLRCPCKCRKSVRCDMLGGQPALCALCSHLKMDGNLLANQSCHRFHSVLVMTSSATSFGHCLCVMTSAAILWMLEFLTSGRAQANSSQTLFINDGCINLFPCQWKPRILAFRFSKFGLAKSCSIDTSVSSTLWSLCATALVPNTREIPPLQGYHIQNKCEFFCSFDVPWFCP